MSLFSYPNELITAFKSEERSERRYHRLRDAPHSLQFSSVSQSCLTLCDPVNRSTPGLPVLCFRNQFCVMLHVLMARLEVREGHTVKGALFFSLLLSLSGEKS